MFMCLSFILQTYDIKPIKSNFIIGIIKNQHH
jgi:hypothetical protein